MVTLTLSSNGVGADISTVNIPFGQMSTAYNNHVAGIADQHDSTQFSDAALLESTTIINAASTVHARLDMIYAMLSGILGGSGNASTRYASRSTDLTSLAATVSGASATGASLTIPRRDSNGGITFGVGSTSGTAIVGIMNTLATAIPLYILNAVGQSTASLLIRDSTGTINHFYVDAAGNTFTLGTLTAGNGAVAVTDATGHVLSAALNTVSPTQGGTGVSNPTAGYVKAAGGATAMATVATIPVGDGGTGQTSYTNGQLLIGNTTGGTLAKGTISGSGGIVVTNGAGTIALSTSGLAASGANGDITSLTGLTTPLSPAQGGTGSGTYTDGQLLIGNSTGNTLTKGSITGSGGIVVTNGHGTIALSTSGLAASGANGDITSLTGLTTPLSVAQGGTGGATQAAAQTALGVPSTTGVGATGSWHITSDSTLAVGANAVTASSVLDFSLPQTKISDGAVIQEGAGTLRVFVNAIKKWSAAGVPVHWDGGFVDLTTYVPSTTGQRVYVLIELNSTANIHVVAGSPVTGPLADVNMPNKDPDATALAMVALQSGQTQILAANITSWRGPGESGSGTSGTTGSQVGHNHAIPPEIRITNGGLDEGFPAPTVTPSMSILVYPIRYRSSAGLGNSISVASTVGPFAAPATGYRIYGVYFDPSIPGFAITAPSDSLTNPPAKPAFSGNQRQICYVHLTSGSSQIKASDDSVNGWIEDVRVFLSGSGPTSIPVGVSDGGTGAVAFGTAGLVMAGVGSTTAPFTTVAATTSNTQGLVIAPTTTPGISDSAQMVLGGGTVAMGTSSMINSIGVDLIAPTRTGSTGNATNAYTLRATGPAYGTGTNAAAYFKTGATAGIAAIFDTVASPSGKIVDFRANGASVGYVDPNGLNVTGPAGVPNLTVTNTLTLVDPQPWGSSIARFGGNFTAIGPGVADGEANQWVVAVQGTNTGASLKNSERAGIIIEVASAVNSPNPATLFHDTVGIHSLAEIVANGGTNTTTGRAWAANFLAQTGANQDGTHVGLEIDSINNGLTDQTGVTGTFVGLKFAKGGLSLIPSGTLPSTYGIAIVNGGQTFHKGFISDINAIGTLAADSFLELTNGTANVFAVRPAGSGQIVQIGPAFSGTIGTNNLASPTFNTNGGALSTVANTDMRLASIGYQTGTDNVMLGVHAFQITGGSAGVLNTSVALSLDVNGTPGYAGSGTGAGALWFRGGNIGVMKNLPAATFDIAGTFAVSGTSAFGDNVTLAKTLLYTQTTQSITANSQTIATAGIGIVALDEGGTPAARTLLILATGVAGQEILLINGGSFSLTFDAQATSHVVGGTANVIGAFSAQRYAWSTVLNLWVHVV